MLIKGSCLIALAAFLSVPVLFAQAPAAPSPVKDAETVQPAAVDPSAVEKLTPEMRGDIYMARKAYRDAIDMYLTCEQNAVVLNKIGIAYHNMVNFGSAKKYYQRSIKKNPKYSEAVNNLGTIFYAEKSYRRAVSQYNRALRLAPNSASVYSNLGTAHFARKQYKEAAEAYQKALALDPEVFEHKGAYGIMIQERNVEDKAKFHYYLAKVYAHAGADERALIYIRKALEEGFKDRKKFIEEPEFAKLQENPEFKQLMAVEPRVL